MKRGGDLAAFAGLVRLQRLAALRKREVLATACERTCRCLREVDETERELEISSAKMDALFAGDTLCLDRLSLATHELVRCDARVDAIKTSLNEAQDEEDAARAACREGSKRLDWAERQFRKLRNRRLAQREENALREAMGLFTVRSRAP